MIYELENFGKVELINYTALDEQTSAEVLTMRNHPYIRKWMHNKQVIQLPQHQSFILALASDKSKQYFVLRSDDTIIGTFNYVAIDRKKSTSSFGLFANPELSEAGIGSVLIDVAMRYAKEVLGLTQLTLHALNNNQRAITFYKKCGFQKTGEGQIKDEPVTFFMKKL